MASKPAAPPSGANAEAATRTARKTKEQKRQEAETRNRRHQTLQPIKARLQEVERELAGKEARHQVLTGQLASPEFYQQSNFHNLVQEHAQLGREIGALTAEWERLAGQIEHAEKAD